MQQWQEQCWSQLCGINDLLPLIILLCPLAISFKLTLPCSIAHMPNKLQIWCAHIQAALWCAKCASAICDSRAKTLRYGWCNVQVGGFSSAKWELQFWSAQLESSHRRWQCDAHWWQLGCTNSQLLSSTAVCKLCVLPAAVGLICRCVGVVRGPDTGGPSLLLLCCSFYCNAVLGSCGRRCY